jgi:hypothetical protein
MKRSRILSLFVVLALVLGAGGVVLAQEPTFFTAFTYSPPSPIYEGDTMSFNLTGYYGAESSAGSSCLQIIVPTTWGNTPSITGGSLNTYLTYVGTSQPPPTTGTGCDTDVYTAASNPGNTGGDTSYFYTISGVPSAFWYGTLTFNVTADSSSAGSGYVFRVATDDSPIAGAGNTIFADTSPGITVNTVPTTRYVADVGQCGGYTPCDTGPNGLATALADGTATTIIVLGVYNADPSSAPTLSGGDTLRGQGGASINFGSACGGGRFLLVNDAATIRDLIFDGTCPSGTDPIGVEIDASGSAVTIRNTTFQNFANEAVRVTAGTLINTGVTYDSNGTGAYVNGGAGTFTDDTFTDNTYGIYHAGGTLNAGTGPGTGSTFIDNTTAISSTGASATIKDNTITGGTTGIYLDNEADFIYGNTVTGASSNNQIYCGGYFDAAAFNYLGGYQGGQGVYNCSDAASQLGSPIVAWTDVGTSLGTCTVTGSGPIFNLGNGPLFGHTPPLGRDSFFYATTPNAGTVSVTGGSNQFKMLMDATGCNPMSSTCWEDSTSRAQTGAGYYFSGSQDPTAITLANVTTESPRLWLPVALAAVALVVVGGALVLLRRRRGAHL